MGKLRIGRGTGEQLNVASTLRAYKNSVRVARWNETDRDCPERPPQLMASYLPAAAMLSRSLVRSSVVVCADVDEGWCLDGEGLLDVDKRHPRAGSLMGWRRRPL